MLAPSLTFSLILLFSLRSVGGIVEREAQPIRLPAWNAAKDAKIPLRFEAFGDVVELDLRRNERMTAGSFQVWKHKEDGSTEELVYLNEPNPCRYYVHAGDVNSAAASICEGRGLHGIVFTRNATLEITPLRNGGGGGGGGGGEEVHVVRRRVHEGRGGLDLGGAEPFAAGPKPKEGGRGRLSLELAVFLDEAGYATFGPYFGGSDERIRDMLLAYVNGIQAIYHHPSLGRAIDITLVRLEVMERQPADLPHFDGERSSLLESFCRYAEARNPPGDEDPRHWDMALYVSGLDFYAVENGRRSSGTMGLATVGTVCIDKYACVIAELGVSNRFGRPYPSAGLASVYIAAHEIGHNLGMFHDSSRNSCPRDGYIMSPSRGVEGETMWSSCSREVAERLPREKPCLLDEPAPVAATLEHRRYRQRPGREWDAARQCRFLLRDEDAEVVAGGDGGGGGGGVLLLEACKALRCRTPHRSGYYVAGPALDGTRCAPGMECRGGECLVVVEDDEDDDVDVPATRPTAGGWSEWRNDACSSGCLRDSKGAFARRRSCERADCEGFHYDVSLCDDRQLCRERRTAIEYAAGKCAEFGRKLPELVDGAGSGLQAHHEPARLWMGCAIFCRRRNTTVYYTPRIELNDLGLDPYFPDGTWCHAENGRNYFCRQHHCLPEDFRFELRSKMPWPDELLDNEPQNASPREREIPRELIEYHSLAPDGTPLLTSLPRDVTPRPDDDHLDEWDDVDDYILLPSLR